MTGASLGKVLVVDDEIELMLALRDMLVGQGYEATGIAVATEALPLIEQQDFDVLLVDLMMPEMDGIALLRKASELRPQMVSIIMTGQGTVQTAVEAMKVGAFEYLLKPFRLRTLLPIMSRAIEVRRLRVENLQFRETVAIYELSQAIAFTLDLNTILDKIADAVLQQTGADEASILLPAGASGELYVAVVRGAYQERLLGARVPPDEGIAGWVMQHRQPLLLNGAVRDPRFMPVCPRADIRSAVSLPMLIGGRAVGVINVNSLRTELTLGQVKGLSILAGTAAAAVENALLHQKVQEAATDLQARVHQQASIAELSRLALTDCDLAQLMAQAAETVVRTLNVDCAQIVELQPDGQSVRISAQAGCLPEDAVAADAPVEVDDLTRYTLRAGAPVVVEEFAVEPRFAAPRWLHDAGMVSGVTLAIGGRQQPFAVLGAYTARRHPFTDDQIHFLQAVASTLAPAVERRRAEQALRESNERLEAVLVELRDTHEQIIRQERLRALGEMASGIAHDLNNTLAMIVGYSELLLERQGATLDAVQSSADLKLLHTAAQDAASTVARLREFYRPRSKEDAMERLDVGELIDQAVTLTQPRWKDEVRVSGITIDVRIDVNDVPEIVGYAADLREALINLILNAVDAMPRGGVLTLSARVDEHRVIVDVSDTGTGIPPDVQPHVFEMFFTTKGSRGTGLGLATVSSIIERHDGSISVTSQHGQGTTFTIALPIVQEGSDGRPLPRPRQTPRVLNILLVEDEPQVRQILTRLLMIDGHGVTTAVDGQDGVAKLQADQFDVIITDRAMPRMNGDQLARVTKEYAPHAGVIMLTGFGEMMRATAEAPPGVDLVVGKPVTLARLRQALAEIMRRDS